MSVFNKLRNSTPVANTTNQAGGPAIKQSAKLEAVSLVLTSFVRDRFYSKATDDLARLKDLTNKVDAQFLAKLAVFARNEFGMRSITHALAGYLAPKASGNDWAKRFYEKVVHRVDDMMEIVAVVKSQSNKCIPNAMRKGFKKAFEKFDAYQLAKYRAENKDIKLVDIVNLVHPKHNKALQNLVEGNLKNEKTWEAQLSQAGKEGGQTKQEVWSQQILNKSLGYLALIRNLRNIEESISPQWADVILRELNAQIVNQEAIRKSLVLPFQIQTAYEQVRNSLIKAALSQAMELSLANVPVFPGKTVIFLDQSGSMGWQPIQIGSLFAAVLAKTNNAKIIAFGSGAQEVTYNPRSLLADLQAQLNNAHLGWTSFHAPFNLLDEKADRIIILSDMQAWIGSNLPTAAFRSYKSRTASNPFIYSFDLNGSGTMQFPEDKVFTLAGFHGDILEIMGLLEQDKNALINRIESITL